MNTQTNGTDTFHIDEAAAALSVGAGVLIDEIRTAATAAERPSARD